VPRARKLIRISLFVISKEYRWVEEEEVLSHIGKVRDTSLNQEKKTLQ